MTDPYGELAPGFVDHYRTLRGALRFELVGRALDQHLPSAPARIVDIGGGAGHQAVRAAQRGYQVVLVDPSEEMRSRAAVGLQREPAEVRERVTVVAGTGERAVELFGTGVFDVVLCHGVLPYVKEPAPLLAALRGLLVPGGVLSLVAKNRDALAMRPGLERRFADAIRAFGDDGDIGGLGVRTRADRLADLCRVLDANGLDMVAWYGVRVFTDHLGDTTAGDDFSDVLEAEWLAGKTDPYRGVARLLHVIGHTRSTTQ